MILSDREIQAEIQRGSIKVAPPPPNLDSESVRGEKSPWSSTTLDLHLHGELSIWEREGRGADVAFEPPDDPEFDIDYLISKYAKTFTVEKGACYPLPAAKL